MEKLQVFKLQDDQWILVKEYPVDGNLVSRLADAVAEIPDDGLQYRIELRSGFVSRLLYSNSPIEG